MAAVDLQVQGVQGGEDLDCDIREIDHRKGTDFIICVIQSSSDAEITAVKVHHITSRLHPKPFTLHFILSHRMYLIFFTLLYLSINWAP
jgi:hypothetical protein